MKRINFILGIHNHQPVGNFPEVFEEAYQQAYKPFIEAMKNHPRIKWSLHSSGELWEFMLEKHPEYIQAVRDMVNSGQLELLSGGYYEPIMPIIPDRDKKGQIQKLTAFLKETFNYEAKGMWLAERVWTGCWSMAATWWCICSAPKCATSTRSNACGRWNCPQATAAGHRR